MSAENFKKIDKDFRLSDSSINVYGFRLKTEGYQIDEFRKIPIGYYDHDDKDGVLLKWEDLRIEGDEIKGKPVINLNHPRGQRTYDEVMNGFVTAASVGKIVCLDSVLETNLSDPNKPTVVLTKWYNKECSLVGLPGNRNATVVLYDANDNEIQLSDIQKTNIQMEGIVLTTEALATLGLKDGSNPGAISQAIKDLNDRAVTAENRLQALEKESVAKQVKDLLDKAENDKKITPALKAKLEAQYGEKPTELKDLLDDMPAIGNITDKLKVDENSAEYKSLSDKTFEQLDKEGLLAEVLNKYPSLFEAKYREKHGDEAWEKSSFAKKA